MRIDTEVAMASNPLHPENVPTGRDRITRRGHGTGALGPSDSSDSGSDLKGAPGLGEDLDGFGLDRDPMGDRELTGRTAGADVGDSNLDSDSDRYGTGERASAGRDPVNEDGADIDVDKVEDVDGGDEESLDPGASPRRRRPGPR
jgi:hypothetical protein